VAVDGVNIVIVVVAQGMGAMRDDGDGYGNVAPLLLLNPCMLASTVAATIAGVQGILFCSLEVVSRESV
jgi:hypothetical protein